MPMQHLPSCIRESRFHRYITTRMTRTPTLVPIGYKKSLVVATIWLLGGLLQALPAAACDNPVARAVSVQGRVEMAVGGSSDWTSVRQQQLLCAGDRLRVRGNSRAGLLLNDETLLRLAENSSIRISAPEPEGRSWLDLLDGVAHFISRVRNPFQVNTPYVNASIEGTEFTVATSPNGSSVTVLEGQVRAANDHGQVLLAGGERALAKPGQMPQRETLVDPLDAVHWALYYPPLIPVAVDTASPALLQSIKAYNRGDSASAFAALGQIDGVRRNADLLLYRASLKLQVGGLPSARQDIELALALQPDSPNALALQSLIATVRNERQQALALARQAVASNPTLAAPQLALSYARQALFQLPAALEAAQQATRVAPDNALAWSRLAEVQLMFRHMDSAIDAATRATSLAPGLAQTQTTLGFARLIRLDLDAARQAFETAIEQDQAAPLPRLGLGLVQIRGGDLAQGRQQIEIAANLAPGNALVRSYLGKAYYEEKRDKRAATQFGLAKRFDDLDPTAWYYDAILNQTRNRPLQALNDIESAIARNDNRAVYRSRLLLDDDLAARNANLADIYDDLGFERLALKESAGSLVADPANASAHRFLSDAYANLPRHEIARVSELLQAQMLSPEITAPVSPSASEVDLLRLQGSGPSLSAYNEYNPLFNQQRLALQAGGVSGGNNTRSQELAVGGFTNRGMISAGYYNESTDGFRENDDSEQRIRNLFGQLRVTPSLSAQAEIRHREHEYGYLEQLFEQDYPLAQLTRNTRESDSYRVGLNYSPGPNHTLLLSSVRHEEDTAFSIPMNEVTSSQDGKQHEVRYHYRGPQYRVTAGLGDLDADLGSVTTLALTGLPTPFVNKTASHTDQRTAYLYLNQSWSWGSTIIGGDYTHIDETDFLDDTSYNPKLGLIWDLADSTSLRLAAFGTTHSSILNNWTIAPTEVAGFNQIYDDFIGTEAKRYAVALDHQFSKDLNTGIELSRRVITRLSDDLSNLDREQRELSHKGYVYWAANSKLSLGSIYSYEDNERDYLDGHSDPRRPAALNTQTLELNGNYFHTSGLFAKLAATYVSQELESVLPTTGTVTESEHFWISDAAIGYRMPRHLGLVKLEIKNLFDREFKYQSTFTRAGTPLSPPYSSDRAAYLQLSLEL
jgi:tetratricopeptide (TPR) repeat protein